MRILIGQFFLMIYLSWFKIWPSENYYWTWTYIEWLLYIPDQSCLMNVEKLHVGISEYCSCSHMTLEIVFC